MQPPRTVIQLKEISLPLYYNRRSGIDLQSGSQWKQTPNSVRPRQIDNPAKNEVVPKRKIIPLGLEEIVEECVPREGEEIMIIRKNGRYEEKPNDKTFHGSSKEISMTNIHNNNPNRGDGKVRQLVNQFENSSKRKTSFPEQKRLGPVSPRTETTEAKISRTSSVESLNLSDLFQEGSPKEDRVTDPGDITSKMICNITPQSSPLPPLIEYNLVSALDLASEKETGLQASKRQWKSDPDLYQTAESPATPALQNAPTVNEQKNTPVSKQKKQGRWTRFKSAINKFCKRVSSLFRRRRSVENGPKKKSESVKINSPKLENSRLKNLNNVQIPGEKWPSSSHHIHKRKWDPALPPIPEEGTQDLPRFQRRGIFGIFPDLCVSSDNTEHTLIGDLAQILSRNKELNQKETELQQRKEKVKKQGIAIQQAWNIIRLEKEEIAAQKEEIQKAWDFVKSKEAFLKTSNDVLRQIELLGANTPQKHRNHLETTESEIKLLQKANKNLTLGSEKYRPSHSQIKASQAILEREKTVWRKNRERIAVGHPPFLESRRVTPIRLASFKNPYESTT